MTLCATSPISTNQYTSWYSFLHQIKFLFQKKNSALVFQGINASTVRAEEEVITTGIQNQLLGINHDGK